MDHRTAIRWWPPIGVLAMVLLGLTVGARSTTVDDWFIHFGRAHRSLRELLHFTDPRLLVLLFAAVVVVALWQRRWRVAVVVAVTPPIAVVAARVLKRLFGRELKGALAYPSGHITVTVAVLGMIVLVAGARLWLLVAAAVFALLGLLGQAFTVHYFTDTIGAVFLSTALVCLAVSAAGLDTCQPQCDVHHSDG